MAIDVVCHMEVDEEKSKVPRVVYKGREYYFCTNLCMVTFKADPEKYMILKNILRNSGKRK
jgi:Cu+-exporting ATPase